MLLGSLVVAAVALCALASGQDAPVTPRFPPDARAPSDRFLLVKPYTRLTSKFQTIGSVITTMSEVRLTPDAKSQNGALWTRETIGMDAFTVEARLRISAQTTALAADGMAIWFTERTSVGTAYGSLPLFTGFGIVLDTYDNTHAGRTPFLALVASNGSSVLENDTNGEQLRLGSCKISTSIVREGYDHAARDSIAVHVEYAPGQMDIFYKLENDLDWRHCLSHKDIFIPSYFYMGVSASTGDLSAQHDLLSLKVYDVPAEFTVQARAAMYFKRASEVAAAAGKTSTDGGQVLKGFFFTLAFFVVLGGLVIILKPDLLPGTQASIDKQKRFY